MTADDGTYAGYIKIVETAHGVRLTSAQVDALSEALDIAARSALSFAQAMRVATGQEDGPRIGVREHVLAVAAELEGGS